MPEKSRGKSRVTRGRKRAKPSERPVVPPRPAEKLLIDTIPDLQGDRVTCISLGRAQFAVEYAKAKPQSRVVCSFLDLYLKDQAGRRSGTLPSNVQLECLSDLPGEELDLVVLPFTRGGDSELAREMLQEGYLALRQGGKLVVSCDNPDDRWFHEWLREHFEKVTHNRFKSGVVYLATKTAPLKKVKQFACEFAFRDEGRLIKAISRPGVFSHRKVDGGARALMSAMTIQENDRVLDIGCGSGVVTLAAAFRAPGVQIEAIDSNPRAVECTRRGAELNGLTNVTVFLTAGARHDQRGTCDLVVANPPYFSNYQIAEIFLSRAVSALKPEGRLLLVAKKPDWYAERMPELFRDFSVREVKSYFVMEGMGVKKR